MKQPRFLKGVDLFSKLTTHQLRATINAMQDCTFADGESVVREGEYADALEEYQYNPAIASDAQEQPADEPSRGFSKN